VAQSSDAPEGHVQHEGGTGNNRHTWPRLFGTLLTRYGSATMVGSYRHAAQSGIRSRHGRRGLFPGRLLSGDSTARSRVPQAWAEAEREVLAPIVHRRFPRPSRFASFSVNLRRSWHPASEFRVSESLPRDLGNGLIEPLRNGNPLAIFASVESKRLFVHVSKQMERLRADVAAVQAPLQHGPEVQSIGMHVVAHVFYGVVHSFMGIIRVQSLLSIVAISEDCGSRFYVVAHQRSKILLAVIGDYEGPHLPVQSERRILHDGSNLRGELVFWMPGLALPNAALDDEVKVGTPASGAFDTARRARGYQVVQAAIGVQEVEDWPLEGSGFVCLILQERVR
jgi:hypothetical protein